MAPTSGSKADRAERQRRGDRVALRAEQLVARDLDLVIAVAERLMREGTIDGDAIAETIRRRA